MGYYDRYYKNEPCEWWYDHQPCDSYWYHTNHGVQPGSIPNGPGAQVLDIQDDPEGGHFFKFNKLLNTDALNYFDIKERAPEGMYSTRTVHKRPINASSSIRDAKLEVAAEIANRLRDAIDSVGDNLSLVLASDMPDIYDAEWCEQDGYAKSVIAEEAAEDNAIQMITNAMIRVLFANAPTT